MITTDPAGTDPTDAPADEVTDGQPAVEEAFQPVKPGEARKSGSGGTVRLYRDFFAALGPDRPRMVFTGFLALISGLLETVLLYLISRVALTATGDSDQLVVGGQGPVPEWTISIGRAVVITLFLLLLQVCLNIPIARSIATVSQNSIVRTRARLIRAQLNSSWRYRISLREGHFALMVGEYCQRSEKLVAQLALVFVSACQVVMLLSGAVFTAPVATVITIAMLGVLVVAIRPFARGVKVASLKNSKRNRTVVADAQQMDRLAAEVTTFQVGNAVAETLETRVRKSARNLWTVRFRSKVVPIVYQYSALAIVLGIIGVGTMMDSSARQSLAPLILILIRTLTYIRQLLTASQHANELAPYFETLQQETERLERHPDASGTESVSEFSGLVFDDVSFCYVPDRTVLRHASFTIDPGDAVGFIGPSGGGKTTTLQLMLRLLSPTEGEIRFSDLSLETLHRTDWAKLVAFVPQDNKLVRATVAENIEFFRDGYTREQVIDAAVKAHIYDEIAALPDGFDTPVGPGSQALSGGQCQRIGIARALLGGPQLLILDEPTSALDSRSESLIRQTLTELRDSTTLILVAHRPATLEICNRIFRVDNGLITESSPADRGVG